MKIWKQFTNYDNDDELLLRSRWLAKDVKHYFQPAQLSELLITVNLLQFTNKTWIYADHEFRLCWLKLSSSYATLLLTTTPRCCFCTYWLLLIGSCYQLLTEKIRKLRFLSHINLTKISLVLSPFLFVHWKCSLQKQLFAFALQNSPPKNFEKLLAKHFWFRLVIVKFVLKLRKWVKNVVETPNLT